MILVKYFSYFKNWFIPSRNTSIATSIAPWLSHAHTHTHTSNNNDKKDSYFPLAKPKYLMPCDYNRAPIKQSNRVLTTVFSCLSFLVCFIGKNGNYMCVLIGWTIRPAKDENENEKKTQKKEFVVNWNVY